MVSRWLALAIGNSRLHWAWFQGKTLEQVWDTPHLTQEAIAHLCGVHFDFNQLATVFPANGTDTPYPVGDPDADLWIASVVPCQTRLWQAHTVAQVVTLNDIPLAGLYATMGIDRALALVGAIATLGTPILVIDAGTALTFTGADASQRLVGGAILPGVQLQMRSLAHHTAALPLLDSPYPQSLPVRWADTTVEAIYSGVMYTILAGIQDFIADWLQIYPTSAIALTGGDSSLLITYLSAFTPALEQRLSHQPHLIFYGIQAIRLQQSGDI